MLSNVDGAHLLVVGYSGNDQEVLSLFKECGTQIRSLYVVNKDSRTAEEVAASLGPAFGMGIPSNSWCDVGFGQFVQSDRFDRYVQELPL